MPRAGEFKFIDFQVVCPGEAYKIRNMQMKFMFLEDGRWFPAPCNGCEFLHGSEVCNNCMTQLTSMFFHNPELDITKPIIPQELHKV